MTDSINIFWIDDDPSRTTDAEHLEKGAAEQAQKDKKSLKIAFFTPQKWKDFIEGTQVRDNLADLFLVDYLLFIKRLHPGGGMSVAGEIRENFPNVPIYMFSVKTIPDVATEFADSLLDLKQIQRNPIMVYYDTMDYRKIRVSPGESITDMLSLLEAPKLDQEKIALALPENIKKTLVATPATHFNSIDLAKWIRYTFLKLPGFVYNSLYSATKLGMNEETFVELSTAFEKARYSGVFARTNPKLWWASSLRDIVFQMATEKLPSDGTTDLSRLAPKLFGLDDSKTSKCAVCGKRYPETVGHDADNAEMKTVHYKCSIPHPEKTRMVYFEEERRLSDEG